MPLQGVKVLQTQALQNVHFCVFRHFGYLLFSKLVLPCFAFRAPKQMISTTDTSLECPTERAVLHTLLYFEIFAYPLTAEEVFHFCTEPGATLENISHKLQNLVKQGVVFRFDRFFQTQNIPDWASKRLEYNQRADAFLPIAQRRAQLIGRFPFVRGVFVSGSLSKHSMRPDSDIDFFIITEPGRLWLARTLLVVFKKIFLFNSHKFFCVNYFIDTQHLTIEEQNLFTATETVTLLPMYGREYFEAFCQANPWAWAQYPHFPQRPTAAVPLHARGWTKRALENILHGSLGAWFDEKAMLLTVSFWKRKFKHLDNGAFGVALKSRRYVSKHHPLHFQQKVLERFEERVNSL